MAGIEVSTEAWDAFGLSVLAGRPIHLGYEPPLVQIVFFLDFPSHLASWPIALALYPFLSSLPRPLLSYLGAFLILFLTSIQWWLIGALLDNQIQLLRSRQWRITTR